jgi:hypothetical protein
VIPGLSLKAQGLSLPPIRQDALEAVAVKKAVREDGRDLVANYTPDLARVLRPQSAYRWMLPYLASLTPQYIENILRQALAGNHQQAWELFDLMLDTSPEIAACTQEFTESVLRKKLIIEPYAEEDEEPSKEAVERSKVVSAALRRMRPAPDCDENNLRDTLRDIVSARWFGTSILEVDFHTDADEGGESELYRIDVKGVGPIVAPRTTFWVHPVCYAWDQSGRLGLRTFESAGVDRKQISQRDYSRADQRGGYGTSFHKRTALDSVFGSSQQLTRFTPHKFLIAKHKAKTGSILGGSILRPLAWWWCASNFCGDWLLNLAQIWGLPWRKASFASGVSESDKEDLRQFLQQMGSNPWILHPDGTEVEIIFGQGATGQSPQAFLFELCDRQIRKVILGQTMSGSSGTMGKGGGQAFGEVEADVKGNKIDSAGEDACAVLNEQLVRAILTINYGDDNEAPSVRLLDEEEGGLPDAQRDQTLAAAGLEIPKSFLRKKYGIPAPRKDEEVIGQAAPAPNAPAPGDYKTTDGKAQQDKEEKEKTNLEASIALEAAASPQQHGNNITDMVRETLAPIVKRLLAIADVSDAETQRALLEKFLTDEPNIAAALKADTSLVKALAPQLEKAFANAVKETTR